LSQTRVGPPEPTEIAGRYQIVQKLGAGAFGTVYKAKDKILGRMLAIKTIKTESLVAAGASLEEMSERFQREAQVSAQLKHPNIVTIHDLGDAEGIKYLAMEFIDGIGLDKVIAEAGRLPVERAAHIGAQVADALDFAHRHKVVHRDIKPANIMIEPGDRVKVTDFGIAKLTEGEQHLTMTGSLLGTPSYMSPEQARGNPLDGRSDLFSLGCVLYEMLAGRKAFRGESITALIFKIITEEPPPIKELDPEIPDELERIISKALAKTSELRYQTGHEMAADLLTLTRPGTSPTLRQGETPTVPAGAAGAQPTVRANPTIHSAATVVPAAPPTRLMEPPAPRSPTAARPAPARLSPPPPPAAHPPAVARKSGGGAALLIGLGLAGLLFVGVAAGAGWYFFLRRPADTQTAGGLGGTTEATTPPPTQPPPTLGPEPSPTVPPTTAPPVTIRPRTVTPTDTPPVTLAQTTPPRPPVTEPANPPTPPKSILDEEPQNQDGRGAGEDLAGKYRGQPGGTSFGTGGRFRPRALSPHPLGQNERPAVATMRHIINAEEAFNKQHGHYGTLAEMSNKTLFLDVAHQGGAFQRAGYRFNLTVTGDGFKVLAMPMSAGGRPFIGDDSGFIRTGVE
jgi:serine/threonine protein kinase